MGSHLKSPLYELPTGRLLFRYIAERSIWEHPDQNRSSPDLLLNIGKGYVEEYADDD